MAHLLDLMFARATQVGHDQELAVTYGATKALESRIQFLDADHVAVPAPKPAPANVNATAAPPAKWRAPREGYT
jgi:hypothetical protein